MQLYYSSISNYCSKVKLLIEYKKIDIEFLSPPGGYGSDEFKKISPQGTIPTLTSYNITLCESEAINEYLKIPPTAEKIKEILKKLGYAPRDLMRKKEDAYTEHNLDNPSLSGDDLIEFMIEYPVLIERPIVLANEKAAIGRPPEQVLEIL